MLILMTRDHLRFTARPEARASVGPVRPATVMEGAALLLGQWQGRFPTHCGQWPTAGGVDPLGHLIRPIFGSGKSATPSPDGLTVIAGVKDGLRLPQFVDRNPTFSGEFLVDGGSNTGA